MSTGVNGLPRHWMVLLCRISWGEGILGMMGVDHRSRKRSSIDLPVSWVVLSAVFRIFTWHSMKLFGSGKVWGRCGVVNVLLLQELSKTLQTWRESHCLCRWCMMVCAGWLVPVAFGTGNGLIWRKHWIGRGTCWTDCRWAGTLYLCGESNWLQISCHGPLGMSHGSIGWASG